VRIVAIELHRVALPLVRRFETSFGVQTTRDVLLVRVRADVGDGWGECVAGAEPVYSSEYTDGAEHVITNYLAPALLRAGPVTAESVAQQLSFVVGHRMAKAALETAVLDAQTRASGQSFGEYFGAVRAAVDCGVSVGIAPTIDELLAEVDGYVADGYRRIKLKIKPGWDIEPVRAVRDLIGDLPLQVDANTAYTLADVDRLRLLDEFDLLLIEQPFEEEDILSHVTLAAAIATPVCLDESIHSALIAVDAIERGATSVVNIKAGRVGGYLEAVDRLVQAHRRRPRSQRGPRGDGELHPARRHLGVEPVLRRRHHRALRAGRRAPGRSDRRGERRRGAGAAARRVGVAGSGDAALTGGAKRRAWAAPRAH
jgi:O-succinylbenzoate synthase